MLTKMELVWTLNMRISDELSFSISVQGQVSFKKIDFLVPVRSHGRYFFQRLNSKHNLKKRLFNKN